MAQILTSELRYTEVPHYDNLYNWITSNPHKVPDSHVASYRLDGKVLTFVLSAS